MSAPGAGGRGRRSRALCRKPAPDAGRGNGRPPPRPACLTPCGRAFIAGMSGGRGSRTGRAPAPCAMPATGTSPRSFDGTLKTPKMPLFKHFVTYGRFPMSHNPCYVNYFRITDNPFLGVRPMRKTPKNAHLSARADGQERTRRKRAARFWGRILRAGAILRDRRRRPSRPIDRSPLMVDGSPPLLRPSPRLHAAAAVDLLAFLVVYDSFGRRAARPRVQSSCVEIGRRVFFRPVPLAPPPPLWYHSRVPLPGLAR